MKNINNILKEFRDKFVYILPASRNAKSQIRLRVTEAEAIESFFAESLKQVQEAERERIIEIGEKINKKEWVGVSLFWSLLLKAIKKIKIKK